jgi:hypothetical protein
VVDPCQTVIISKPTIADQTYTIGISNLGIPYSAFTEANGNCGPVVTTSSIVTTNIDSSFIAFDLPNSKYNVQTNDALRKGTYTITVKGTILNGRFEQAIFTLTVIDPCEASSV